MPLLSALRKEIRKWVFMSVLVCEMTSVSVLFKGRRNSDSFLLFLSVDFCDFSATPGCVEKISGNYRCYFHYDVVTVRKRP